MRQSAFQFATTKKKEFKIDSPKIIYASTRNDDSIINALENYKKNNPNIHITIKLHPGDNQHNRINKDLFSRVRKLCYRRNPSKL